MKPLHELSVSEAGNALRGGDVTSEQLTRAAIERIEALDGRLGYFYRLTSDRALSDARKADSDLRAGLDRGALHGIPYGLKDILDTAGIETTCNSRVLLGHRPLRDSAVAARLSEAGGVLLGKLSTSEFACGGPSNDLPFPASRNPWNLDHYTGGSSSGSAGSVSVGFMRIAVGTDTGGSTRVPAHYCGVVGLKPTYGLVSTRGLFPLAPSFDHCAPLSRNVEDIAHFLNALVGYDPDDPASVQRPAEDYARHLGKEIRGCRVAYARQYLVEAGILPELQAQLDRTVAVLSGLGAEVEEVALPDFELFRACHKVILAAEAFGIHEETLRTRPRDYGLLTYRRLVGGAAISASDLFQAFRLRRELCLAVWAILERYDVMVTASGLGVAPRLETGISPDPPPMIGSPTIIGNVSGNPAICIPIGLSTEGLPMGIQIFGRHFAEADLLRVAAALEAAIGFGDDPRTAMPPIGRAAAAILHP